MAPYPEPHVQLTPSAESPELDPNVDYGDFRNDLARHGFAVVPGVLSKGKAAEYVDQMHYWLESFDLGYKRDDESTWLPEFLPVNAKGGLYQRYGVAHEQFHWSIREEPAVIDIFEKIWGTRELLAGFDGCNISVPHDIPSSDKRGQKWAHVDQSPLRTFCHCVQRIVNLAENGPNDGGLMVLHRSKDHFAEMFEVFAKDRPEEGWRTDDEHEFTDEQLKWLEEREGARWEKVCAGPGDVILWDSRTCHYGAPPTSRTARVAAYVCYKPASLITPLGLEIKKDLFDCMISSSHDPTLPREADPFNIDTAKARSDAADAKRTTPDKRPVLTQVGRRLAGLEPY